jgi:hypothetical protein
VGKQPLFVDLWRCGGGLLGGHEGAGEQDAGEHERLEAEALGSHESS